MGYWAENGVWGAGMRGLGGVGGVCGMEVGFWRVLEEFWGIEGV